MTTLNINSLVEHEAESDATTPKADRFAHSASARDQQPHDGDTSVTTPKPIAPPPDTRTSTPNEDDNEAMDLDEEQENEDSDGEGDENSRKRKGQRFFCVDYPPCSLSFTRSEHLARHIRKHTGERPFQCHCSRRFSRLDNLRQHAQTVHVNEEIPAESLAATGTRFQRQIRTDRVRQNPRPRSGTMGSTGGHSRGHSRNLSNSSIASTTSGYSTVTEAKRRPPPLLMANESSRVRIGEPPQTPPPQGYYNAPHSPNGLSTPTSATFSAMPGSPGFPPSYASPQSSHSRASSLDHYPHRRLSVPSGVNPFQQSYGQPGPSHGSSSQSSVYGSPTAGHFPGGPSHYYPPGEDPRRRTWHPSTLTNTNYNYGRPATSGLAHSQTPDGPYPAHTQQATAAASQGFRLPGIETFDDSTNRRDRGLSPPRRVPSPVHPGSGFGPPRMSEYPPLDDNGQIARPSSSWGQSTLDDLRRVEAQQQYPAPYHMGPPPPHMTQPHHMEAYQSGRTVSSQRQKWNGPHAARTSPEDSSSSEGIKTPGTATVEVHPMIMPSSGFIEPQHHIMQPEGQSQVRHNSSCPPNPPHANPRRHA
jgi:C2H2 transcription facotor